MPNEEVINHYGLIRMRVAGRGNLTMRLLSLDEIRTRVLSPVALLSQTSIEPTRLSNFNQQRAQLELRTVVIDETFVCSKIIIFIRPIATSYPQ